MEVQSPDGETLQLVAFPKENGKNQDCPWVKSRGCRAMQPTRTRRTGAARFAEGSQEEVDSTWQKQTKTFIVVTQDDRVPNYGTGIWKGVRCRQFARHCTSSRPRHVLPAHARGCCHRSRPSPEVRAITSCFPQETWVSVCSRSEL